MATPDARTQVRLETTKRQRDLANAAAQRCENRAERAFMSGDEVTGYGWLEAASAHRERGGTGTFKPRRMRTA